MADLSLWNTDGYRSLTLCSSKRASRVGVGRNFAACPNCSLIRELRKGEKKKNQHKSLGGTYTQIATTF